jgi:tight adherence protein B
VALRVGAQDCPLVAPAAAVQAIGGDAAATLRSIGARPGCAGLVDLADGWTLCERTGMPLALEVRRVAEAVRAEADNEAAREAELSSARSTGRLMVVLPLVGMMLGYFVDADPLHFLLATWPGQICLLGAACLASAGLIWTQRLSEEHL